MPELVVNEGLVVGTEGTLVLGLRSGTVSVDPPNIATVSRGAATFTLTGARAGDFIVVQPPAALNDDLIFCGAEVTADDTVTIYLYNPTGGGIDDTARNWRYTWMNLTR